MSKDVNGEADKVHLLIPQKSYEEEEEEEDELDDHKSMKLLDMEELVPISQTLITPSLARLFNLNLHPHQQQFFEGIRPSERSHGALSNEELQHMQLQEDYHSSKAEEEDSKLSTDERCLQIMMDTFGDVRNTGGAAAGYKRSHLNAGLEGYSMQLSDGVNDHAEGFGMNHLVERENSSNSGDGAGSGGGGSGGGGARTLKRPRLVWTPQLHKRFVDAVSHLGIKNAVPKTIMQLMNVEGLTRENVASHLQKYRLYLRRVQQGNLFSSCANSPNRSILGGLDHHHLISAPLSPAGSSDHLFSSSSIPSTNMAANNHMHHHRPPGHINPMIPTHMQSLLLPQPQHQLNQAAMAMIKSPSFSNQHLNPQRFGLNAADSSSPTQRSTWPSPHTSVVDINGLHHIESNGTTGSASPPRRALTLFPH